jgi:4-amino-4-deoxy-L-arabinose transferase-like glycosyltransferase
MQTMSDSPNKSVRLLIKEWRPLLLLFFLLVLVLMGYLSWRTALLETPFGQPPLLGVLVVVAGALLLWLANSGKVMLSWWREQAARYDRLSLRITAVFLSTLFAAWVLAIIPTMTRHDNYLAVTLLWLLAIFLFVSAVAPPQTRLGFSRDRWRRLWHERRGLLLAVGGIGLLALLLRLWQVQSLPYTLSGDEASQGLEAIQVINREIRNPFTTGWLGVPTMSFFFNSLTIRLFGPDVLGLRLPWVFVGTATVFIAFFLVKRLKGTPLALVVMALLATYHYHIHYSRLGSNQIADPMFLALSLIFLYRALDRRNWLDWAMCGIVAGLAFYFYAGARLTPIVIITVLGYLFVCNPRQFLRQHSAGLLVAVAAFLITAGPMIQYAVRFPDDFNARINQVGIIQSGWLESEVEMREEGLVGILFDQFQRAALAFNYYPDRTVWYGLRQPLLDPFFGVIFLLGLSYGTLRLIGREADMRLAPMVAWWWGGMILGGMLTESPPSSQRLITLAVPTCFFVGLMLWEMVQLGAKGIKRFPQRPLLVLAVTAFALISLKTYFIDFTPLRLFGGPHAALATEIAPRLNELKDDHTFYFIGAPWMYWGFATLPYLVPGAEAEDILEPLQAPIDPAYSKPDRGEVYIFLPARLIEIRQVRSTFPQGQIEDVYSPVTGSLMVTLYIVPPEP